MSIECLQGSMFEHKQVSILVNPVNTVGVMGKGVALIFKRQYPEMFKAYQKHCVEGFKPGQAWVWCVPVSSSSESKTSVCWIINIATKQHWRDPSKPAWVKRGLFELQKILKKLPENECIALPALGCGEGGLSFEQVKKWAYAALSDVPQQILLFEPHPISPRQTKSSDSIVPSIHKSSHK